MTGTLSRILAGLAALVFSGPIRACSHGQRYAFPVAWSTAHFGERLSLPGYRLAFDDAFDRLRLTPDGGAGPWFAPIHSNLGMGDLTSPGDAAFEAANGVLTLRTRQDPSGRWREANLQTMDSRGRGFAFQNGYVEMRAAPAPQPGAHDGLWLLSMNRGQGHAEVDVLESYGAGSPTVHVASHFWPARGGGPPGAASQATWFPRLYQGFHRFGLLATDDLLISYVDGREVARIARLPDQRAPMYVLLSLFENPAAPRRTPATFRIDDVRVFTPAPSGRSGWDRSRLGRSRSDGQFGGLGLSGRKASPIL